MAVIVGDADDNELTGGSDADQISGEDGDDTLEGGEGADTLNGGNGFDVASYAGSSIGVNVNLTLGGIGGDSDGDVLIDIEDIIGSAFGDILAGDAGANYLYGGLGDDLIEGQGGNDVIEGGSGDDLLIGGDGSDLLDYSRATTATSALYGLVLDFNSGYGDVYHSSLFLPDRDTVSGFEGAIGTAHADWMRGGAGDEIFLGGAGDDVLLGGDGGDFLVGDDGVDSVSYFDSTAAVEVSLFSGFGFGGHAEGDNLLLIENIVGSAHNDILEGDFGDNLIVGGAGADELDGLAGFDTLDYRASFGAVVVNLALSRASGGDAAGDVISGFEGVIGSAKSDRLHGGNGNQKIEGFSGNDYMDGGAGIDTVSFEHTIAELNINLVTGVATGAGNDTLVRFENVIASSMSDIIVGDTNDNVIAGMGGGDGIDGGDGFDTADYRASDAAVAVNLAAGMATGGHAQGDVLENLEGLIGSAFNDTLTGSAGDDRIEGGLGDDLMDGGDGIDTLSFEHAESGVSADLSTGTTCGCGGETDTFSNFENITGSAFDDTLIGDIEDNILIGGAGADTIDGGGGFDTVSFAGASTRVILNLHTGVGTVGDALGDTYTSIERAVGTNFNDHIYGGAASESFEGGLGNDVLLGRRGDDTLTGGAGNDRLNGGAGADTFVFGDEVGNDIIDDYSTAQGDIIVLDSGIFADFAEVLANTTDDGLGNCVIAKDGVQITLTGVTSGQLVSGGFDFQSSSTMMMALESAGDLAFSAPDFGAGAPVDASAGLYPRGVLGPAVPGIGEDDSGAFHRTPSDGSGWFV